jgi:hypothetical protein
MTISVRIHAPWSPPVGKISKVAPPPKSPPTVPAKAKAAPMSFIIDATIRGVHTHMLLSGPGAYRRAIKTFESLQRSAKGDAKAEGIFASHGRGKRERVFGQFPERA